MACAINASTRHRLEYRSGTAPQVSFDQPPQAAKLTSNKDRWEWWARSKRLAVGSMISVI